MRKSSALAVCALLLAGAVAPIHGQEANAPASAGEAVSTSTDFLSDEGWRALPREERRRRSRASTLARYEPSGKADASRLDIYLERFRAINVYDPRLFRFEVKAGLVEGTTGTVRLSGEVSMPQYRRGIEEALTGLGFTVAANAIETLPSPTIGAQRFGLVTTSVATLRKEPRMNSEQVNSVALGGFVRLLRESAPSDITSTAPYRRSRGDATGGDSAWFLAQSPEGYLGFVRENDIKRAEELIVPDLVLLEDTRAADGSTTVPAGANLVSADGEVAVAGLGIGLPAGARVAPLQSRRETAEEILAKFGHLLGTRYVWGGVTSEGLDCSGFSQLYYKSLGVFLPRDAVQQAIVGQITAYGEDVVTKSRAGDLIFFLSESGRVSHVGVSLGDGRVMHSSRDKLKVQPLAENEDEDDDRTLAGRALYSRKP